MSNIHKEVKSVVMPVIHTQAAGIDVGSRSHFVAVGQGKDDVMFYFYGVHEIGYALVVNGRLTGEVTDLGRL